MVWSSPVQSKSSHKYLTTWSTIWSTCGLPLPTPTRPDQTPCRALNLDNLVAIYRRRSQRLPPPPQLSSTTSSKTACAVSLALNSSSLTPVWDTWPPSSPVVAFVFPQSLSPHLASLVHQISIKPLPLPPQPAPTMAGPTSPSSDGPSFAPPQLPPGWIAQWDGASKKYYYVQLATGVSQWDIPTQAAKTGTTPGQAVEHPYGTPPPELITHPDGSQTVKHPDGTLEPIMADGTRGVDGPAGDRGLGVSKQISSSSAQNKPLGRWPLCRRLGIWPVSYSESHLATKLVQC